jgi:hypothetical protein
LQIEGCRVVSAADPCSRILSFPDRNTVKLPNITLIKYCSCLYVIIGACAEELEILCIKYTIKLYKVKLAGIQFHLWPGTHYLCFDI